MEFSKAKENANAVKSVKKVLRNVTVSAAIKLVKVKSVTHLILIQ